MSGGVNFDDLDDRFGPPAGEAGAAAIREAAHVANGGEALFPCPSCGGSGKWIGRFVTKPCFKCQGKGKVSRGVVAAAKGKVTRAVNLFERKVEFEQEHVGLISALRKLAEWHEFAGSLIASFEHHGSLTDRQIETGRSVLARQAERDAERTQAREAKGGKIGVAAIDALFETAIENGLQKPIFRTERLTIKPARGKPGVLYITDSALGGEYVGKIVEGRFEARREAQRDTFALLTAIAADPLGSAVAYGRSTGRCGCCGRELTDPKSVAAGIGPICATTWGI